MMTTPKKRLISLLLTFSLVLSCLPVAVFAADDTSLCEHHAEHTADCGYAEEGSDCGYVCDICAAAVEETTEPEVTEESTEPEATTEPEETTEPEKTTEPAATEETKPVCTGLADCVAEEHEDGCRKADYDHLEGLSHSWTNPLYGGHVDIPQASPDDQIAMLNEPIYHEDVASAGAELRTALRNRVATVSIGYRIPAERFSADDMFFIGEQIFEAACEHTGVPNEGDYLRWHVVAWNIQFDSTTPGADGTYYDVILTYNFVLISSAEHEEVLDKQLAIYLDDLNPTGTDYEKIKTVYDWICANVIYDYVNLNDENYLLKHSAYAALVQRMAVCQGYSNLLYRMALEMGIDCRIITGVSHGENHSWNIVKLDGQYYNLDATWDSELRQAGNSCEYFLKCDANFPDHTRDGQYQTEAFVSRYPIAESDYVPQDNSYEYVDGDFVFSIDDGKATLVTYTGNSAEVTIPDTADGVPVTTLGVHAFQDNTTIEKVTFAASVVDTEDGWCQQFPELKFFGTFANCVNLKTVVIPENSQLSYIGGFAFYGCKSLTVIVLPSSIRELGISCFDECESLEKISLPEGLEEVGQNAFTNTGIKTIHIPASLKRFDQFNNMQMLETFTVAEGNARYRVHEGVLYDNFAPTGSYSGWTLINYPSSKPEETYRVADFCTHIWGDTWAMDYMPKYIKTLYIGNAASAIDVMGGDSLSRIECTIIPDDTSPNYQYKDGLLLTKDGKKLVQVARTFKDTVVIPDGVEELDGYLFWYNDALTHITIPSSVKTIAGSAFSNCDNLSSIVCRGDLPTFIGEFAFVSLTMYYPKDNPTWANATIPTYYSTITLKPFATVQLEGEELLSQSVVYINGLPYPVQGEGENRYVNLPTEEDCFMVTYTYHVGDANDIHTQYPTGMKVYKVSGGEITHIPELDSILQYSGSSIRITGNKGIRMITSLTKDAKAKLTANGLAGYKLVEYGTALCFASEIPEGDALVLGKPYARSNYAYKKGVADPVFATSGNLTQYTNVLVGFSLDQCKDDIAMRPYIILEDAKGEQITIYGGTIYRSIGYIAYQNRNVFNAGTASYNYVWEIIHHVYGDKYDADYKG